MKKPALAGVLFVSLHGDRNNFKETTMLTKSDLLSVQQCARKLWLEKNRPELVPTENTSQDRRAMDGHLVNERARLALGPTTLWPKGNADKRVAMRQALEQMALSPNTPVVEMPLVHLGLYARLDALIPTDEGRFILQETKSSTFPLKKDKSPDKPDDNYLEDVAIQAWVMEGCGLPLERAELNLLNSPWHYLGDEDYSGLFRTYPVTKLIEEKKERVPLWIAKAREVLSGDMPATETGTHCKKPHDCSFRDFCVKLDPPAPDHPIELLPDAAGKNLARKLKAEKGYVSVLEPKDFDFGDGKSVPLYLRIQKAHAQGSAVLEPGADTFMANLAYPRYYFDFEGIDLPVPRWFGVRPYEQIAFQWSCHIERSPGVFEHHEFLDITGNDPTLSCIEKMHEVINPDDNGPILVYYQTYEKGRLEGMAVRHPGYEELLEGYIGRLVDLHPLVKKHFYDPRMKGSFSIKKVLPVIAPDLDYKELVGVQEGTGAQIAYLNVCFEGGLSDEARQQVVDSMLAYCGQDTWAMVELGYFLEGKSRPHGLRPTVVCR